MVIYICRYSTCMSAYVLPCYAYTDTAVGQLPIMSQTDKAIA